MHFTKDAAFKFWGTLIVVNHLLRILRKYITKTECYDMKLLEFVLVYMWTEPIFNIITKEKITKLNEKKKKKTLAKVSNAFIYPIKFCAEISLSKVKMTTLGFDKDRIFQVCEYNTTTTTTTETDKVQCCTPLDKKYVKLLHIQPTLNDDQTILTLTAPAVKEPLEIPLNQATATTTTPIEATPMIAPKVQLDNHGAKVSKWFESAVLATTTSEDITLYLTNIRTKDYERIVEVNPDQGEDLPPNNSTNNSKHNNKRHPISLTDEAPYLLTSTSSLQDLNRRLQERGKPAVDMRRFRPNIVIDGLEPWKEDTWSRIRIAGQEFHVWQRFGRCAMTTTIDRDSLERGPEPLATLSTFRERAHGQRNFGMYLFPVDDLSSSSAWLTVGDEIEVLEVIQDQEAEWTFRDEPASHLHRTLLHG